MLRRAAILVAFSLLMTSPAVADVTRGKALFASKNCAGCHTINGQGGKVGPDLTAAATVPGHDRDWHMRHLMDPAAVVPGSIMPKLVTDEATAADLTDYLMTLTGMAAPKAATAESIAPAAPTVAVPSAPDAARGQKLFGKKGCSGCHTIRGKGGTLGPDLTFEGEVAGHDKAWHLKHLADPKSISPGSAMPKFKLKWQDAEDLVAYLTGLVKQPQDRQLSPALAARFDTLKVDVKALDARIGRALHKGRNVDDLRVLFSQIGTHMGTVDELIRLERLADAPAEIAASEDNANKLDIALDQFDDQLHWRLYLILASVIALAIGALLLLRKVNLLTEEWREDEAEKARKKADSARPVLHLPGQAEKPEGDP